MQTFKTLIIIGSSTGGPQILRTIFHSMPKLRASIIIVQHIPASFTHSLCTHLQACTDMTVSVAKAGDTPQDSQILVAPTGAQCMINENKIIDLSVTTRVHAVCPAVDCTMLSIRENMYQQIVGIILTGMGHDGTKGIQHIHALKGITIAQDPQTAPIATMPQSAIDTGAVHNILKPEKIREKLLLFR
ncbi:MAG: chemotaxis protein CheB [Methanospirillaceae archaeon]|nr:chemotaxis protein CheB [Methanospirillaceae archaeon]